MKSRFMSRAGLQTSAPTTPVLVGAVVLAGLSIAAHFGVLHVAEIVRYQFELLLAGFLLLLCGALFRNL
ncbi:hypothetical protein [Oryzibacter oryziterrae]|uniref:hypothetical protein n=1 Tax=Oryzibacter oryziterrae TaxID=2766474 RepID=UPI001F303596|nr:hypothetical protein [Oryzibacter oryziterrae]